MEISCVTPHKNGALVSMRITPRAPRTEVTGMKGNRLAVRVAAPPVEGKANAAICAWMMRVAGIERNRVHILRGEHGRDKDVLLEFMTVAEVCAKLFAAFPMLAAPIDSDAPADETQIEMKADDRHA